jgi:glyoxylase-like metal-dependent hydrolase (beta-lactamase superfamily II)
MCLTNTHQSTSPPTGPPYHCSRLNDTTYLIVHHDKYSEFPFIYVKLYLNLSLAVVIDTGCGAHSGQADAPVLELKTFIHSVILSSEQASFDFLVLCTHCHFDHIGGIEAFSDAGARIVASGHDRDFLKPERRDANSLCGAFGLQTPKYEISHYAQDGEELEHKGHGLGLQIIHTPGHTPDSIAIYDEAERWLFVGDTCYQRFATMPWGEEQAVPIILPRQGNWRDFIASMYTLHEFVLQTEAPLDSASFDTRIRLAAGHTTSRSFAEDFLHRAVTFCEGIVSGAVPEFLRLPGDVVAPGGSLGDEMFVLWQGEGRTDFSLMAPERFKDDF